MLTTAHDARDGVKTTVRMMDAYLNTDTPAPRGGNSFTLEHGALIVFF